MSLGRCYVLYFQFETNTIVPKTLCFRQTSLSLKLRIFMHKGVVRMFVSTRHCKTGKTFDSSYRWSVGVMQKLPIPVLRSVLDIMGLTQTTGHYLQHGKQTRIVFVVFSNIISFQIPIWSLSVITFPIMFCLNPKQSHI